MHLDDDMGECEGLNFTGPATDKDFNMCSYTWVGNGRRCGVNRQVTNG